ncbi:MAG: SBBP repeat-containing protein, partial [Bacteroidetes bacterium]|nr:SBBP repeat-containing protein [Bacteroidota bacterium]
MKKSFLLPEKVNCSNYTVKFYWLIAFIILSTTKGIMAQSEKAVPVKFGMENVSNDMKDLLNYYDKQIYFTENKGQWPELVRFKADFPLGQAVVTNQGMMIGTFDPAAKAARKEQSMREEKAIHDHTPFREQKINLKGHGWVMNFLNSSASMRIEGSGKHADPFNYFVGEESSKVTGVSNYQEIWYKNVYANVDVRYYPSAEGTLEYDIICKAGFDKNKIAIQLDGIHEMETNSNGHLILHTSVGNLDFPAPVAYQVIEGKRKSVDAKYVVNQNTLKFELGQYEPGMPLVIDPIALRWATWVNNTSTGADHGHGIWVDPRDGSIYIVARVDGSGLITVDAFDSTANGNVDLIVGKYREPATIGGAGARVWQTYIGGSNADNPYAMEQGPDGNLYITGYTASSNYPLTGGAGFGGGASIDQRSQTTDNIFITKIDTAGDKIKSSVIGGNGDDGSFDLRINSAGDIIICGNTASTNLATLYPGSGASNTNNGSTDVIVFKINQDLSSILWMKNYGGSGIDQATIMVQNNSNGDIFIGGYTTSTNFPTVNPRQSTRNGSQSGFIQKLASNGNTIWSSYFQSASSQSASILCMEFNTTKTQIYFGGITSGLASANISASGTFDATYNSGTNDFFVTRMDTNQNFVASTYLGGSSNEVNMMGLNLDLNNDVYIFGYSNSNNFPVSADALQSLLNTNGSSSSNNDKTFTKLSSDLSTLQYSTYYGGTSDDYDPVGERGIKFSNCRIYTIVTAQSNNIPLTQGAITTNKVSSTSIYEPGLVVWANPPDLSGNTVTGEQQVCKGHTPADLAGSVPSYSLPTIVRNGVTSSYPNVTQSITYQWQISSDNTNWTNLAGATGQNLTGAQIGPLTQTTYFRRIINGDACVINGAVGQIIVLKVLKITGTVTNVTCFGQNNGSISTTITDGTPAYNYLWSPGGATTSSITGLTAGTYRVIVSDASGCKDTAYFNVTQPASSINANAGPDKILYCVPSTLTLNGSSTTQGVTFGWTTIGGHIASGNGTASAIVDAAGTYILTATDPATGCSGKDTAIVTLDHTPPVISCPPNTTVNCQDPTDPAYTGTATATDNSGNSPQITHNDVINPGNCPGNYSISRTWTATDNCNNSSSCIQTITVHDITPPSIGQPGANATISCPAAPQFTAPTATDACDQNPSVIEVSDITTPGNCAGTYSRTKTWKAVDACGNQSGTVSQTIIVQDITAPSIGQPGANATISCPAIPQFTAPTATDACDQNPQVVEVSDNTIPGKCPNSYIRTKTWKAVDACGNQSGVVGQSITVEDNTPPTIGQPGANTTISCPASPQFTAPTATDACDLNPRIVEVSDVTTPGNCAGTYSRTKTWKAVDACDNHSGTVSQTIIVQDITAPSIGQPGADATISCPASPQFTAPTASDACDQNPSVIEVSDITTPGECAGTYSRTKTWKAVDACGNQSGTVSQTIIVQDITAPSIGQPGADATISCPASPQFTAPTASDACDQNPSVIEVSDVTTPGECAGTYSRTKTWKAVDACGNQSGTVSQTIIVQDITAPSIGQPGADATISCPASPQFT